LLELFDPGKTSFFGARPESSIADTNFENATGAGINAISPISVIHAARRSQRHCVQYSISIRGVKLCAEVAATTALVADILPLAL
jgi:hypothetical protein